jgi:PhnB protein
MAQKINPVPKGYRSATPALVVRNAAAAIDYYSHLFGATELSRIYGPDGITIQRAEIRIGNSLVHLSDEIPSFGILSPLSLGGTTGSIQLFLDDVNTAWDRAIEGGSVAVLPLEDTYWGERTGRIVDGFGHVWTLSQRTEVVSKAELKKRVAALFAPQEETETATSDIDDDIPTVDIRAIEQLSKLPDDSLVM